MESDDFSTGNIYILVEWNL